MKKSPKLTAITSLPVGEGVIERLEEVLADARAGKVSMVAIAVVDRDGGTRSCRSHAYNTATLLGAIEMMKARMIAHHFE